MRHLLIVILRVDWQVVCEYLGLVPERLELQRITGRVFYEHRRLFTDFTGKTNSGVDNEIHPRGLQPIFECVPVAPLENDTEVSYRNFVPIDFSIFRFTFFDAEVSHDLVAIKIEIDPMR